MTSFTAAVPKPVVTDLTISTSSPTAPLPGLQIWHRIEKELYLHESWQKAWLYVALANEEELTVEDLLVVNIHIGAGEPASPSSGPPWESRAGGIWVLRTKNSGTFDKAVTDVDVLFGKDAVDPRPEWDLKESSLSLHVDNQRNGAPVARVTVFHGRAKAKPSPDARPILRVREDGRFRIVQISDTHMVTGVGVCKDALDARGENLPESEAYTHEPRRQARVQRD